MARMSKHRKASNAESPMWLLLQNPGLMTSSSPIRKIQRAFGRDADLGKRVNAAIVKAPELKNLFVDIASYINQIEQTLPQLPAADTPVPLSKKRKLEDDTNGITQWDQGTYSSFKDISFSIPQRKKLRLELSQSLKQGIRGISATGDEEISIPWAEVQDIICLPVPEKAQAQCNFGVFSKGKDAAAGIQQTLWTLPAAPPKEPSEISGVPPGETYKSTMMIAINTALKPYKKRVIEPTDSDFSSQIVQAHRKGEKAYHIKAFRGAKDGFLFLLSTGIIWGFKKPLEFFPFDAIDSVSYTSVLQRTFNINVTARATHDAEPHDFEFSMVDQADFAGIDAYMKKHRLQDASMAEQRRAKKVNVNGVGRREGGDAGEGIDGDEEPEGELQKAQREAEELEDEEEEEDENFDPGSEGESEGEVETSSDEDGEDGEGGGGADEGDEDMDGEGEDE